MKDQKITVQVYKHDGTEHRRWHARLRERAGSLLVLDAEFDVDVSHELLGKIGRGTKTIEYYWLDRWYCVFEFMNPDGSRRLFYCNINTPPEFDGQTLSYIDLDIDVLVQTNFSYQVLDMEEFEVNSELFGYSADERKATRKAVEELISLVKSRQFPFQASATTTNSK